MKKSRTFLAVLLAVLLVAIQQFGFAHALTHLASPASNAPARSDTQHPAEKACIQCVAFTQLGAGLTGEMPQAAHVAAPIEFAAMPLRVFDPEFIPAFQPQAPPILV